MINIQLTISLFAHAMSRYAVLSLFLNYIRMVSACFWSTAASPKDHLAAATLQVQTLGSRGKRSSSRLPTISNAKIYAQIISDSDCLTSSGWFGRMLLAFRIRTPVWPLYSCEMFSQLQANCKRPDYKRRQTKNEKVSIDQQVMPQIRWWNTYLQPAWGR